MQDWCTLNWCLSVASSPQEWSISLRMQVFGVIFPTSLDWLVSRPSNWHSSFSKICICSTLIRDLPKDPKESNPVSQWRNISILLWTFCINRITLNTNVKILVISLAEPIRYLLRFSQISNWSQHRPMQLHLKDFQTAFLRGHNTHITRSIFFSWIFTANLQKCLYFFLNSSKSLTSIHPPLSCHISHASSHQSTSQIHLAVSLNLHL